MGTQVPGAVGAILLCSGLSPIPPGQLAQGLSGGTGGELSQEGSRACLPETLAESHSPPHPQHMKHRAAGRPDPVTVPCPLGRGQESLAVGLANI